MGAFLIAVVVNDYFNPQTYPAPAKAVLGKEFWDEIKTTSVMILGGLVAIFFCGLVWWLQIQAWNTEYTTATSSPYPHVQTPAGMAAEADVMRSFFNKLGSR